MSGEAAARRLFDPERRRSRRDQVLIAAPGLYALYLKPGSRLPDIEAADDGLVYIGKADGAGGLKRRCHFRGGTRNHSPRKSLAVLLKNKLGLEARPVLEKSGAYKTWQLQPDSERALDEWMHDNLDVAILADPSAVAFEKILIREFAPVLNLADCALSECHQRIIAERRDQEAAMKRLVQTRPTAIL